jgi:hypothetical protein
VAEDSEESDEATKEDSEESDEPSSMASPVEDTSSLPGQTVTDQEGVDIGEVKDVYAVSDDAPMWVTIEASTGLAGSKTVFVPIARLKEEQGNLRVPYSVEWIKNSPQVEAEDELSAEDDRMLRDYYAIDHADQEFRAEGESYASKVPRPEHPPRKVDAEEVGEPVGAEPIIPGEGETRDSEEEDSEEEGSDGQESEEEGSREQKSEEEEEEGSEAKGSAGEGGEEESSGESSEDESAHGESDKESGKSEEDSGKSEGESGKSEDKGSGDERSEERSSEET